MIVNLLSLRSFSGVKSQNIPKLFFSVFFAFSLLLFLNVLPADAAPGAGSAIKNYTRPPGLGSYTTEVILTGPNSVAPGEIYSLSIELRADTDGGNLSGTNILYAAECINSPCPNGNSLMPSGSVTIPGNQGANSFLILVNPPPFIAPSTPGTYTLGFAPSLSGGEVSQAPLPSPSEAYGEISFTVTAPVPEVPVGLTATPQACGTGQIDLSWNPVTGATSYTLRDGATIVYSGSNTNYSHTGLTPGSGHSYTISATNSSGASAYSNIVSANAPSNCATASGFITATTPCTVAVSASSCTSNDVTWSTNNATTPGVWTSMGVLFSSSPSGVNATSPSVRPDASVTLDLRNNNSGGTILSSVTITAICTSGSTWNGSSCVADPVPTYSCTAGDNISNATICSGDDTSLSVNTPNSLTSTCSVPEGSLPKCQYTCNVGYTLSGGACVASSVPAASITAPDCTIIAGENSCLSSVSWNTSNLAAASIRQNSTQFSSALSSTGTPRPLVRGSHTFTVYDGITELASDVAIAECAPSAPWNGSVCDGTPPPPPVVTLSAVPTSVTTGNSSTLTWTVTGTADSCWASDGWSGWKTYNATNNQVVSPIVTTNYSITCYNQGVQSNTPTATVTVTGVTPGTNLTSDIIPTYNGTLVQGQNVTFNGVVRNSGTENIKTAFNDNFTYCWGAGCSPATVINSIPQGTINAGVSRNDISTSLNLSQTGTLRVQHCIDSTGIIAESDETTADNCKTATFSVNPPASDVYQLIICPDNPSAIPVSTNQQLAAWYWNNYSGSGTPTCGSAGSVVVTNSAAWSSLNTPVATVSNGSNRGVVTGVTEGNATIQVDYAGLTASKNITVTAGGGGPYLPPPIITIESNPSIVRSGQTAPVTVAVTANYDLTCTLSGAISGIFSHTPGTTNKSYTSVTLTAARVAQVTCTDPDGTSYSASTTISVIPTFQEI